MLITVSKSSIGRARVGSASHLKACLTVQSVLDIQYAAVSTVCHE